MAFEGLTEKISATFKKLRGKGRLKESDVKEAMREIRMALLEADVSYKVVKDFTKSATERCVGADVLESLTPAQMIVKIVNEELTKLMGSDIKHIRMNPNGPTVVMLVVAILSLDQFNEMAADMLPVICRIYQHPMHIGHHFGIVEHANQADQMAAIPCADHRIRMLQCLEQPFRPLRRFPTYRLEQRLNLLNSKPLLFRVFDSHGPSRQP